MEMNFRPEENSKVSLIYALKIVPQNAAASYKCFFCFSPFSAYGSMRSGNMALLFIDVTVQLIMILPPDVELLEQKVDYGRVVAYSQAFEYAASDLIDIAKYHGGEENL